MRYKFKDQTFPFITSLFSNDGKYKGFRLNCPSSKTHESITFFLKKGLFFDDNGETKVAWFWEYRFDEKKIESFFLTHQQVLDMCSYWIKSTPLAYWESGEIKTFMISDKAVQKGLHLSITKHLEHNVFPETKNCNSAYLIQKI